MNRNDLTREDLNFAYAREYGSDGWERVVDSEAPMFEDGRVSEYPDCFKLEWSGWRMLHLIQFKPLAKVDAMIGASNESHDEQ